MDYARIQIPPSLLVEGVSMPFLNLVPFRLRFLIRLHIVDIKLTKAIVEPIRVLGQ